ncbi:MAG: DeoR/GlpR family DNA-binding transcription regulator [Sellimonas intestinalis]
MLTEKRQKEILRFLDEKGSVTVQELTERLDASESTIRRDLAVLHQKGALVKVFGGAVQAESRINIREEKVALRKELNKEEKIRIAAYAATLVEPDDFVYLDAGTTTEYMIPFLTEKSAVFSDKCSVPCIEADGERIPGYFDRRRIESRDGGDRRKRSVCQSSEI